MSRTYDTLIRHQFKSVRREERCRKVHLALESRPQLAQRMKGDERTEAVLSHEVPVCRYQLRGQLALFLL
jgi:hypothetical protein